MSEGIRISILDELRYRRFTRVRQLETEDCGPAVVASLAAAHGHRLTLMETRELTRTHEGGTSLMNMLRGLRAVGFEAKAARGDYAALSHVKRPCIVLVRKNGQGHYLLVFRADEKKVLAFDPADGLRTLPRARFEAIWTGSLIELQSAEKVGARPLAYTMSRLLLGMAWDHRSLFGLSIVILAMTTAFGALLSWFTGFLIDRILPASDASLFRTWILGFSAFAVMQLAFAIWRASLAALLNARVRQRALAEYFNHIFRVRLEAFRSHRHTSFLQTFYDTTIFSSAMNQVIVLIINLLLMMIAALVLFSIDARFGALYLLAMPMGLALNLIGAGHVERGQRSVMRSMSLAAEKFVEACRHFTIMKMFGREEWFVQRILDKTEEAVEEERGFNVISQVPVALTSFLQTALSIIIMVVGYRLLTTGDMSVGQFVFAFGLLGFLIQPIFQFANQILVMQRGLAVLSRLEDFKTISLEPALGDPPRDLRVDRLSLRGVVHEHLNGHKALRGVDLEITRGETIAVVGASGCGKTSLMHVLSGIYEPASGVILVNGEDRGAGILRRRVRCVFQEPHLIDAPVLDNVALGDAPDEARVRACLEMAGALDFVEALPDGINTTLGQDGQTLSLGQRQRISLARAFYEDPEILIFDEAFSNIDSRNEGRITAHFLRQRRDRTTILVAHRFATVRHADRVLVMDQGRIVASGAVPELLDRCPLFRELFADQIDEG